MAISFRGPALGLMVTTACGGTVFKADEDTAGQGGGSGAAITGGRGGTGGREPAEGGAGRKPGGAGREPAEGGAGREPGGAGREPGGAGREPGGAGREPGGAGKPAAGGQGGGSGEPTGGQSGAVNTVDGGSGGAGEPVCAVACSEQEECTTTALGAECRCTGGLVREGDACRLPRSCDELHRYAPSLASGTYALRPEGAAASFQAYCGMMLEGGGWTLVVNEGPTFDPMTNGVTDALCYASSCTSIGYSTVLLGSDVMIDISNSPIANTTYSARVIVTGVHAMSRGKTLRTLFTTGPHFVEAENNSNLAVRMRDGSDCSTLPTDMAKIACEKCDSVGCKVPVMIFGDGDGDSTCRAGAVPRLAIGAANDYATPWNNCAGWPQAPDYAGADFYPDYVRVWVR